MRLCLNERLFFLNHFKWAHYIRTTARTFLYGFSDAYFHFQSTILSFSAKSVWGDSILFHSRPLKKSRSFNPPNWDEPKKKLSWQLCNFHSLFEFLWFERDLERTIEDLRSINSLRWLVYQTLNHYTMILRSFSNWQKHFLYAKRFIFQCLFISFKCRTLASSSFNDKLNKKACYIVDERTWTIFNLNVPS